MDVAEIAALKAFIQSGGTSIEAEIIGEKATSLGHHGRQVERALADLRSFDPDTDDPSERIARVKAASRAVWAYFVTRESCGMREHAEVIRDLGIPGEVLVRLGAMER